MPARQRRKQTKPEPEIEKNGSGTLLWRILPVLLLLLASIPMFLDDRMLYGHDLLYHMNRIRAVAYGLCTGDLPVFIGMSDFGGYGHGHGFFYPNIFLTVPAMAFIAGASLVTAWKMFVALWWILSACSMFYAVRRITGREEAACWAALLYAGSSYFVTDAFLRAALGEMLAFPFVPLVLLGAYENLYGDPRRIGGYVIGWSGLLLSHLIMTFMMIWLTLLLYAWAWRRHWWRPERFRPLLYAAGYCFGLTAFFAWPMFEQMRRGEFLYPMGASLAKAAPIGVWEFFWEWSSGFPGIGVIFLLPVGLWLWFFRRKRSARRSFLNALLLMAGICLVTVTALMPWEAFFFIDTHQFRWRVYLPATAYLALAAGLLLPVLFAVRPGSRKIVVPLLMAGILSGVCGSAHFAWKSCEMIAEPEIGHPVVCDYFPNGMNLFLLFKRGNTAKPSNPVAITMKREVPEELHFQFAGNRFAGTQLELPLLWYYGYAAFCDGVELPVTASPQGLVQVRLPDRESGTALVRYRKTPVQYAGMVVSLLTLGVFCCQNKRKRQM